MERKLLKMLCAVLIGSSIAGCTAPDTNSQPKVETDLKLSDNRFVLEEESGSRQPFGEPYRRERLVRYGNSLGCLYTETGEKTRFEGKSCFDKKDAPRRFAEAVFEGKVRPGMLTERKETFVARDNYYGDIVMVNYSSLDLTCLRHGAQLDKCWDAKNAPKVDKGNLTAD